MVLTGWGSGDECVVFGRAVGTQFQLVEMKAKFFRVRRMWIMIWEMAFRVSHRQAHSRQLVEELAPSIIKVGYGHYRR